LGEVERHGVDGTVEEVRVVEIEVGVGAVFQRVLEVEVP
jgi:hypothetical protein